MGTPVAADFKNDAATDGGYDLAMYSVTSPITARGSYVRLDVGNAETIVEVATANPLPVGGTLLASLDTKAPALGQALAAASVPVVLTAAQLTTLTPPAAITGFATEATLDARTGSLTETAPATDTASSGINGRLQRIAQRITSLIALLPASLGQKAKAASLAVTLASDQDALPITDNGGSVTVDGSVSVSGVVPGTSSTSLGKSEDAVAADGDTGVMALAVRKDTAATTVGADGDYAPFEVDGSGRLWVHVGALDGTVTVGGTVTANAGTDLNTSALALESGGNLAGAATSLALIDDAVVADDAAFTPATTKVVMAGATFDDVTPDSVNEGDAGAMRMSANRNLYVQLRDAAGNERGLNIDSNNRIGVSPILGATGVQAGAGAVSATTQRVTVSTDDVSNTYLAAIAGAVASEDTAAADGSSGIPSLWVRRDTPANSSDTDGDFEWPQMSAGRLWCSSIITSMVPGTSATSLGKAEDAAHASGDTGVMALAVRSNTAASTSGADGDYQPLITNTTGHLWVDASGQTLTVTGTVAHDAADSGSPMKVGGRATTALSALTLVADADRTNFAAGIDQVQITRPHTNLEDVVTGNATNTDGTSTQCIAAQAAGIKTYLTTIILANSHATTNCTVDIKDGTTVKLSIPVPANGGAVVNLPVPLPGTAATAWNFDPSAAVMTISCSMVGFKSKV